ncbi:helix-turn-helix domain-containing protein [Mesorhizobium sp. WSM2239]|uniref:Helix-turn-helix domain-containing protein n=2 Tax=unclassified Mesorhizobium TaxID=325217 RepID=A0AAU8D4Z3_9HYPH
MHSTAAAARKAIIEIQPRARSAPTRPAGRVVGPRGERVVELCESMIDIVAALFNVSGKELRRSGRTDHGVARVRQIAMYVSHVVLRLSMNEVGHGFGRDRTTVLHACHLIEDMRDDQDFDCLVARTERVALAAFRYRLGL